MYYQLHNGRQIPSLGLGTFLSKEGSEVYNACLAALKVGYRLIDTASVYANEASVGKAVRDSGIPRAEIYVSSKLLATKQGREIVKSEYEQSLAKMGLDYIDQYLIHWVPRSYEVLLDTWRGFEDLYKEGKVKSIGICNISLYYLDKLIKDCEIKPMVVQVELHPLLQQEILLDYCRSQGIVVMSYGPFAKGDVFKIPELQEIANKHQTEIANIVIKWGLMQNIVMIPKSVHQERIARNFMVDFMLDDVDMAKIKNLNDGLRLYRDPDNNPYIYNKV